MAPQDKLNKWWDGLNEAERADALASGQSGVLSQKTEKSLRQAGVIPQGSTDKKLRGEVVEFLKMRH